MGYLPEHDGSHEQLALSPGQHVLRGPTLDGETQVGIEYKGGKPQRIHSITVISSQTDPAAADTQRLCEDLLEHVVEPVLKNQKFQLDDASRLFINPTGPRIGGAGTKMARLPIADNLSDPPKI